MEINLEPRYRNYWLDLARKEEKEKEEARRKALSKLVGAIDLVIDMKTNKKQP